MIPEHCPNPDCQNFQKPVTERWFTAQGTYKTAAFGSVKRYRCRHCNRYFSDQTFSLDYFAKKKLDYPEILSGLITSSGNRDISRKQGVRNETIQNRIERYSRWAQGIHQTLLAYLPFTESFAADGLESFSESQFYPNNINLLVGRDSQFLYSCGLSILRRKGRMTAAQKEKRKELEEKGKASPSETKRSMKTLFHDLNNYLAENKIDKTEVWTDEHKSYPAAISGASRLQHRWISSRDPRNYQNPLFAVNYYDREVRKDMSDHARETVQYARHPACMMSRFTLYRHHHNYLKPFRIRKQDENTKRADWTHAEEAGLDREVMDSVMKEMEGRRFFLGRLQMNEEEKKTWLQLWKNPGCESKRYIPHYISV